MDFVLKPLLVLLYLLWLPIMLLGRAFGSDPLQLKKPASKSYWLVRQPRRDNQSYFSQASESEGQPTFREREEGGKRVGTRTPMLAKILKGFGRLFQDE